MIMANSKVRQGIIAIFKKYASSFSQYGFMPMHSFRADTSKFLALYTKEEITAELEQMEQEGLITFPENCVFDAGCIALTPVGKKLIEM